MAWFSSPTTTPGIRRSHPRFSYWPPRTQRTPRRRLCVLGVLGGQSGQDLAQGGLEFRKAEGEAALERALRAAALAAVEDLDDLPEHDPRLEARHRQDRPASQHPPQRLREVDVADRFRAGAEERTGERLVLQRAQVQLYQVLAVDPAHPLAPVAQAPA